MIPQPQVVKVSPCQVYLSDGTKFCFNPEQIKAIQERNEHDKEGIGCWLYISGFQNPFELACSYELFLERAGVNPQKLEETRHSDH